MPVYVDPSKTALIDVDIQTTFMPAHMLSAWRPQSSGGLPVRDGHVIVPVVRDRLHKIFPMHRRYATCDRHKKGSISYHTSFIGFAPCSVLLLDEVRKWTSERHRIAPHASFSLQQCRDYLELLEKKTPGGGIQVLWPEHGMEGTHEGELHPDLPESEYAYVQLKGLDPACDSYSGFLDNLGRPVGLGERLREDGIETLFITGLASDFCVKWTAINAVREYGFRKVYVVLDATRPVDIPGNEQVAGSMAKAVAEMTEAGVRFIHSSHLRGVFDPGA